MKNIAEKVKGWAGNWDAIWDNVLLRAKIKEEVVKTSERLNMPDLLEAEFNTISNHAFHELSDEVSQEFGIPKSEEVFPRWQKWLEEQIKKREN